MSLFHFYKFLVFLAISLKDELPQNQLVKHNQADEICKCITVKWNHSIYWLIYLFWSVVELHNIYDNYVKFVDLYRFNAQSLLSPIGEVVTSITLMNTFYFHHTNPKQFISHYPHWCFSLPTTPICLDIMVFSVLFLNA